MTAHRVCAREMKTSKQVTGKLKENNMKYSDYMLKTKTCAERQGIYCASKFNQDIGK